MIFHWPQIVIVILSVLGLTNHIIKHGTPNQHSRSGVLSALTPIAIVTGVLYAGEFFKVFSWPQMAMVVYWTINFARATSDVPILPYNGYRSAGMLTIFNAIAYAGGFYG